MSYPLVSIVGRPNVGKSSLFNRIIGSRVAVVADQEGVTRDLLIRVTMWNNTPFQLMDTGGFIPRGEEVISRKVNEQIMRAIQMSDVVLFMVDARSCNTQWDLDFAQMVKKLNKKVFVLANKAEKIETSFTVPEFWSLGLGEPIAVSALSGMGVSEVLEHVTDSIPKLAEVAPPNGLQLAILGRPNAGKSTLINRLVGEERLVVSPIAGTTRDAIDVPFNYNEQTFNLIDTAGLRKKARVHENVEYYANMRSIEAIGRADVCILLVDAEAGFGLQDFQILELVQSMGKGIIIVLNKWDIVDADNKLFDQYVKEIHRRYTITNTIPITSASALTGKRLTKILDMTIEVYERCHQIIGREKVIEFFNQTLSQKAPPATSKGQAKMLRCCQILIGPVGLALEVDGEEFLTGSYLKYWAKAAHEYFDLQGVPLKVFIRSDLKLRTDQDLIDMRQRLLASVELRQESQKKAL